MPDTIQTSNTAATDGATTAGPARTAPADPRDPRARLERLLDTGTLDPFPAVDDTAVLTVRGRIDGVRVTAYCTDATRMGGSLGAAEADHICRAVDDALGHGGPVVGLWHSGGAKLADGVRSMDGMGRMFSALTRASGRIPQLSVVLGPAAGAAAYGPALTDLVVQARAGRMFVTGPEVVRKVTGQDVDMESLGGTATHGRLSGVAHVTVDSEHEALGRVRALAALLGAPHGGIPADDGRPAGFRGLVPTAQRRVYDVRHLVRSLLDVGFEELQGRWAPSVVIGLGRLRGRTIGLVANNPLRKGGCLDSISAEKAARFVRMCDGLGVPLLVLVDTPGYLPGVDQEEEGIIRRGAKLLHAFAAATVPRVTLITRKAYGGACIAMNSRSLGATAVFAWPGAEIAVMGAEAAVDVMHRKRLAAAPEAERASFREALITEQAVAGGLDRAIATGFLDAVIEPETTRKRLASALITAAPTRGRLGNIPL